MSARLREIARRTEDIVHSGHYRSPQFREVTFPAELESALAGTRLYGPDPVPVTHRDKDRRTHIEVTGEGSIQAAHRLSAKPDPVAVIHSASARNPGGGYLNGAQAQEEALCRDSALYATLLRAPEYYAHHRAHRDAFYTDRSCNPRGAAKPDRMGARSGRRQRKTICDLRGP